MSAFGPKRHFAAPNNNVAIGVTTDIDPHGYLMASVVNDPSATLAVHCGNGFSPYQSSCFSGYYPVF
jgi:hypothetical protein